MGIVVLIVYGFSQRIARKTPVVRKQSQKAVNRHVSRENLVEDFIKVQFTFHQGARIIRISELHRNRAARNITFLRAYVDKCMGDFAGQCVNTQVAAELSLNEF